MPKAEIELRQMCQAFASTVDFDYELDPQKAFCAQYPDIQHLLIQLISLNFRPSVAVYALLLTEMSSVENAVAIVHEVEDDHVWHPFLESKEEVMDPQDDVCYICDKHRSLHSFVDEDYNLIEENKQEEDIKEDIEEEVDLER